MPGCPLPGDEAEEYLAKAMEFNTRGKMKFSEASTQLLWGRMLAARRGPGDLERARTLLEQARATSTSNGYAMIERRAIEELFNSA
jgi:hypothetical protein